LDLRGRKQQDAKENDIVRNFMVFINHEILFGFLRTRLLGWTHGEDEKCYKVVVPNCENKIVPGRFTRGVQACASQINCMAMEWFSWLVTGTREGSFEDGNVTSGVLGCYALSTG
jgi:hypothetical protein